MYHVPGELWPPAFDAAIFDFDGTIADTASIWHEVDEAFLGMRGISPVPESYSRMLTLLGFEGGAQYTIETFGLDDSPEDICEEWNRMGRALYRTNVCLRDGAEAYIEALRSRGVRLALATTNEPEVLDAMERVNVNALFDVRVHGCEVGVPKDRPDIYLEAARRMGVAPERCIVFEDIAPGLRAARSAGFLTCALRSEDPSQLFDEVRDAAELYLHEWTDIKLG
jgi:HAD superfamily hydrolase (TIGR01509 family)